VFPRAKKQGTAGNGTTIMAGEGGRGGTWSRVRGKKNIHWKTGGGWGILFNFGELAMNQFVKDLAGGIVIILAAGVIGIVVNTVRGDSVPLIQHVPPAATAGENGGGAAPGSETSVETIDAAYVMGLVDAGDAFIIDARPAADYNKGHIPGSINIPYDQMADYVEEVTSLMAFDARIVCYCNGPDCDFSDQVATELRFLGYTDVGVFVGGWEHWEQAGYEVEITETDQ
jgi:rhodanese-related sulfurtransferase